MKMFVTLVHIDLHKLYFLRRTLFSLSRFPFPVNVSIITNISDSESLQKILEAAPKPAQHFKIEIINRGYDSLPSPWLLAWVHKVLMYEKFEDNSYTHFMNIEDDLEVTFSHFTYWLKGREELRSHSLVPGFMRVERDIKRNSWVLVDYLEGDHFQVNKLSRVLVGKLYGYVNLPRFYQGMFLYDRDLMAEYIFSGKYYVDEAFPSWGLAIQHGDSPLGLGEASHEGLSRINLPSGFTSRCVVPVLMPVNALDPVCFVHHLPDKYVNISDTGHSKVEASDLLVP